MTNNKREERIRELLEEWANREYGQTLEFASSRSSPAKKEFERLESYLITMYDIGFAAALGQQAELVKTCKQIINEGL